LTLEYAAESGAKVDEKAFHQALEAQKERSRSARHNEGSMKSQEETYLKFKAPSHFCWL
jgi:alanyl-tRNA synthetase